MRTRRVPVDGSPNVVPGSPGLETRTGRFRLLPRPGEAVEDRPIGTANLAKGCVARPACSSASQPPRVGVVLTQFLAQQVRQAVIESSIRTNVLPGWRQERNFAQAQLIDLLRPALN